MISKEEAINIAQAKLDADQKRWGVKGVLILYYTVETEYLFSFLVTIENPDGSWAMYVGGNGPIIISKLDGSIHESGSIRPREYYIQKAERKIKNITLYKIDDFLPSVWKRLNNDKSHIATEIPAHDKENNRRWMAIYAHENLSHNPMDDGYGCQYKVIEIELSRSFVGTDQNRLNAEGEKQVYFVHNEEELMELLTDRNVNPNLFAPPWHCKYPLH